MLTKLHLKKSLVHFNYIVLFEIDVICLALVCVLFMSPSPQKKTFRYFAFKVREQE